ncbi:MAG TPA: hypothetical protein VGL56_06880 [Fimbriimonadaceae bacterium]|jgi:hypothetical protein
MQEVHLSDQLYQLAKKRASDAGFTSVDEFVADIVQTEISEPTEDYDYLFTPERIANIDKVLSEVKAGGKTYTPDEVDAHLSGRRAAWIQKNGQ